MARVSLEVNHIVVWIRLLSLQWVVGESCRSTCEAAGLGQQERAPGHEEKKSRLQQGEVSQFSELGHVIKTESQGRNENWHIQDNNMTILKYRGGYMGTK